MEHNPAITFFLVLGIILAMARIAGSISRRLDQPRVLGELLIGIILGPTVLDMLNATLFGLGEAHLQQEIIELAEFGVLLLMFKIGLEVHIEELVNVGRVAILAGLLGALIPVVLTLLLVLLFGYAWQAALFAGVTLAATSVSISAQVLIELGLLRTKEGNALLAAALVDDVVAILLVSLTVAIAGPRGGASAGDLLGIITRMAGYIMGAFLFAWFGLWRLINWADSHPVIRQSYGLASLALMSALLFGWSADYVGGVAAITGAFIAGIGLSRARPGVRHEIDDVVSHIAYAFLVPIFFVSVGLQTDLSGFPLSAVPLMLVLLVTAVASKLIGSGLGARMGGFNNIEALRLGVCMISRGEVGLIIASLGLSSGILVASDPLFASLFVVIILSTVLTPPLVRRVFSANNQTPA